MILLDKWAFWIPGRKLPIAGRHPRGRHYEDQKLNPPVDTNRAAGI
jgi:hypothetical protein